MIRATIDGRTIAVHYTQSGAIARVIDEDAGEKLQVFMSDGGRYVEVGGRQVRIAEITDAAHSGVARNADSP